MLKKRYASRKIRGKLKVCRYLSANGWLKSHVPDTIAFSLPNLELMAGRYDMLYIKPDVGSMGIGISMLKRTEEGYELFKIVGKGQLHERFESLQGVYDRLAAPRTIPLIIQQGITLDRVHDRPYDIRVMVQRMPRGAWVCTGFMVKVGAGDKIVTNYYQGGALYTMAMLGRGKGMTRQELASRVRGLAGKALQVARTLSRRQPGMREMGIDFAFDEQQRLWVLEVNSNHPQFHPMKTLDRRAYNRMMRFAASYGRRSAK
ncbi:YheC/YheD family protein [Paenibacillus arenilitoris]|uniref:YheC/YheD family protein n=1 Tax=Paenibacillus arenilitoris TaxID=2772299 RepID=A0A927CJ39_9BACL|nr:YheC/YheD family protein [Paenibacillus arenilitoris]MBD2868032.1 YheC/YheD family protein [Paenibacillus arenilitoris]